MKLVARASGEMIATVTIRNAGNVRCFTETVTPDEAGWISVPLPDLEAGDEVTVAYETPGNVIEP